MQTAALVALDGTIDFFCLPAFDSPTVFAHLLDAERGGRFAIVAKGDVRGEQRYVRDTNVLVTRFITADDELEIVDFMPVERLPGSSRIVRLVRAVRGTPCSGAVCASRFAFDREVPVNGV